MQSPPLSRLLYNIWDVKSRGTTKNYLSVMLYWINTKYILVSVLIYERDIFFILSYQKPIAAMHLVVIHTHRHHAVWLVLRLLPLQDMQVVVLRM